MIDMALVTGIAGNLKTAFEIGKAVKEINDMSAVKGKVIEMQDLILSAQSSAMAAQAQLYELLQENAELKRKADAVDQWNATAARYALRDYGGGTYAYELKADAANGEPGHRLCQTCFEKGKKSILQFKAVTASHQDLFKCMPCGQDYFFGVADTSSWDPPQRERELW